MYRWSGRADHRSRAASARIIDLHIWPPLISERASNLSAASASRVRFEAVRDHVAGAPQIRRIIAGDGC